MQWSVETYPLPLNDARIGIWSAQDHSKIQPHDYRSCALPLELWAAELVPGAGFEPAAIPLCKRGGFDHSHHPGITFGARSWNQTSGLDLRTIALYSTELSAQHLGPARGTSTRIFFVRIEALYAIELERR